MGKFIEREKMSRKARKELDGRSRAVWGISPVTRKTPNKKAYNRKKNSRDPMDSGSFSCNSMTIYELQV